MVFGLITLLRMAWVAATLPIIVASLPVQSLGFFHQLLAGFASRGKTMQPSSKFAVPQRFFFHFYVVAALLTTCLVLSTWFYAYMKMISFSSEPLQFANVPNHLSGGSYLFSSQKSTSLPMKHTFEVWKTLFVLLMMEAQVVRRLYETLYVFNYSLLARMHLLGYLAGLFFYTAAPLSLGSKCVPEVLNYVSSQVIEFNVRSHSQIPKIEFFWWEALKPLLNMGWCQWVGAILFLWGWMHQLRCHAILGSLREQRRADEYILPKGDWFEYVTCPHYLAEMIIYGGMFLASGLDVTVWFVFLFVVSNLVFAAAETHRWYHHKFDNYPHSRWAVIPWIF